MLEYKIFSLPIGTYELVIIGEQITEWIELTYPDLKNVREKFMLTWNEATSKAEFIFKDEYGGNFDVECSMNKLLGFDKKAKIEGKELYRGETIVDITRVSQLIFNCNVTSSNYIDGREMPFLYNCTIDVPVGYRLTRELTDIAYKKLTTTQISTDV